ncbi:egl nine homolog 1 [Parasteatoda tepidariorum]|uniref:hypoxia-inducible factor-proline dioxygenase n=1 Tax=Parasteatoda tepidariorum TaxID=114398 RepID=A0A2L2YL57_PARTP|nr:egl nine homolog 1 [Parasteatoda tepidariorum]
MEIHQQMSRNPATFCNWCSGIGNSVCNRCKKAYYCCRDHQIKHWPTHKKECKQQNIPQATQISLNTPISTNQESSNFSAYGDWSQNTYENFNQVIVPENDYSASASNMVSSSDESLSFNSSSERDVFSSLSSDLFNSENSFWDVINTGDAQNLSDLRTDLEKERAIAKISEALQTGAPTPTISELNDSWLKDAHDFNQSESMPLKAICSNVISDMNKYGICVLDKFMGDKLGNRILSEVKHLYAQGIFEKGELINKNTVLVKENIRRDVTAWVAGTEPGCAAIYSLMQKLDLAITTCNKMPNNGVISNYKLHRRTKAMIACYPGNGTFYKKHVDNPLKDGRCVTCIYYLNQNWDVKKHGGLLRLYPTAYNDQVSVIEPIFDRMIFFWSDRRNPHEVLPAFATRFAITVWYFDADERSLFLNRGIL